MQKIKLSIHLNIQGARTQVHETYLLFIIPFRFVFNRPMKPGFVEHIYSQRCEFTAGRIIREFLEFTPLHFAPFS